MASAPARTASSQVVRAAARDDADAADLLGSGVEDERLAGGDARDAREQLARGNALARQMGEEADRLAPVQRERLEPLGAERVGEQRVVPDHGMGVERQVVGGQRDAGVEEQAQATGQHPRRSARTPGPQKSP